MRRKDDTMRDTLLNSARDIADTEGIDAVNIRSIAKRAGIASGTVYNYFLSKDEILLALTEEYWKQTLLEMKTKITSDSFCGQLEEIYSFLKGRIEQSAGKLMNSLRNVETAGQIRMISMQTELETAIIQSMEQDAEIRKDIWDETFTKEKFAHFITMNITMLLKAYHLLKRNRPPLLFGVLSNIPFAIMGIIIIVIFAQEAKKAKDPVFRFMPLAVTLLFGFYHPVVLFSGIAPTVGLFIIP